MTDPHIKNRKRLRERHDNTAIHGTEALNASNTTETLKLDIVCQEVSIQATGDGSFAVDVTGSIDGINYFMVAAAMSAGDTITYGKATDNSEHLIKSIKATRTAGSGKIMVVGV